MAHEVPVYQAQPRTRSRDPSVDTSLTKSNRLKAPVSFCTTRKQTCGHSIKIYVLKLSDKGKSQSPTQFLKAHFHPPRMLEFT